MMGGKKGDGPALIIGIGKPKKDEEEGEMEAAPDSEESSGGDELGMHADAMFDALKADDKDAFREALQKCFLAHEEGGYEETEEE